MGFIRRHVKFFILVIVVAFIVGALTGSKLDVPKLTDIVNAPFYLEEEEVRHMVAPAVDNQGEGIPSDLIVTVRSGDGKVLVNINNVLAGFDTQESAINAAQAAADYTGKSLENLDIIYSIDANAPIVSGASAGAGMAILTIAAIEDINVDPKVSITGAIANDSIITEVGGVVPKAEAVRSRGVDVFLVPTGQGTEKVYEREIVCDTVGTTEICKTKYFSTGVSLGVEVGIEIIEVSTLEDAIPYFFN